MVQKLQEGEMPAEGQTYKDDRIVRFIVQHENYRRLEQTVGKVTVWNRWHECQNIDASVGHWWVQWNDQTERQENSQPRVQDVGVGPQITGKQRTC